MKYETPKEVLLVAAANSAAVQANGNFLGYKETFVSSCAEQNIVGTCLYDQSSCLLGHQDFCTAKPFPNNLFSILIIQAGYMKSGSLTKENFLLYNKIGDQGNYSVYGIGKRRMQDN
jgi:hypothetical protein